MSNNIGKSTNGGLKRYKAVGGGMVVDEKENEIKIPPEGSMKIVLPKREEDFMHIPLVPDIETEKVSEEGPDKE